MRKFEVLNEWVDINSRVLVLGCGNGEILKELKKQKDIRAPDWISMKIKYMKLSLKACQSYRVI